MWVDNNTGYIYASKIYDWCTPWISDQTDASYRTDRKKILLNCGGTIVSTPDYGVCGVKPFPLIKEEGFKAFLDKYDLGYVPFKLKLSQEWDFQDYKQMDRIFLENKGKTLFITHGTDNVSFFAPWVDLLSIRHKIQTVIMISQRSLDRPTSDFYDMLKKLTDQKFQGTRVITRMMPYGYTAHNPYEIKKYGTFKRDGFYSENMTDYMNFKTVLLKNRYKKQICKSGTYSKPPVIKVQTPFDTDEKAHIRLIRGLANTRNENHDYGVTIVNHGPSNPHVYQSKNKNRPSFHNKDLDYTWESLCVLYIFGLWK